MDLLFAGLSRSRLLKFIAVPAHSRDFGWCDFVYPLIIESPVEEWVGHAQFCPIPKLS